MSGFKTIPEYWFIPVALLKFPAGNFNSATGINQYSGIVLNPDTSKIANNFPSYNKLSNVDVIIEPGGFTIPILKLNSDDDYVNQEACGVRYYGSGFDVIYLSLIHIWRCRRM